MNSLIFNATMILVCSVAVIQFCTQAFSQYARLTTINFLFNVLVDHLRVFGTIFDKGWFVNIYLVSNSFLRFGSLRINNR